MKQTKNFTLTLSVEEANFLLGVIGKSTAAEFGVMQAFYTNIMKQFQEQEQAANRQDSETVTMQAVQAE